MLNTTTIKVNLTQDRFAKPLIIVESSLGNGMEIYPAQLRALAATLCKVADDADAWPGKYKLRSSEKREYPLANFSSIKISNPLSP